MTLLYPSLLWLLIPGAILAYSSHWVRERHVDIAPDAVMRSLAGRTDGFAETLRARCWKDASDEARASGLVFCDRNNFV